MSVQPLAEVVDRAEPVRVLFVVPTDDTAPGARYRVFQYLEAFRLAGLECDVIVRQSPALTRQAIASGGRPSWRRVTQHLQLWMLNQWVLRRALKASSRYDRLYIYKLPMPSWFARRASARPNQVLYDFDDALDSVERRRFDLIGSLKGQVWHRGLLNAARSGALVLTSNARNATMIRALGGTSVVVPTCVPVGRYVPRDRQHLVGRRPVVGWIGTPSTAPYLREIEEPLRQVGAGRRFDLRLVGAGGNPFRQLEADVREWSAEREAQEIHEFDVGIMPMPDNAWTRGKAALKALQYGASGAPIIASWTETNAEILGQDEGTLFARSPEDWVEHLRTLLDDPGIRSRLGRLARQRVVEKYSVERQAGRLAKLIRCPEGGQDE